MIRKAFLMSVNPQSQEEYKRRHDPIWNDLTHTLREHGVHNYSIFLHEESSQLFGYVEIEDESQWFAISSTDVCRRWWKYMKDIMPSNPDNSPLASDLLDVFHMD